MRGSVSYIVKQCQIPAQANELRYWVVGNREQPDYAAGTAGCTRPSGLHSQEFPQHNKLRLRYTEMPSLAFASISLTALDKYSRSSALSGPALSGLSHPHQGHIARQTELSRKSETSSAPQPGHSWRHSTLTLIIARSPSELRDDPNAPPFRPTGE